MFKRPQADIIALILATVAEFSGLFFWLHFVDLGERAVGIAVLVVGMLLERVAVYISIRAVYGEHPPHPRIALNLIIAAIGESVAWIVWLVLADSLNGVIAAAILTVFILLEHSVQLGYFRRAKPFAYVLDGKTIVFSILEGVVAFSWLYFVRNDRILIGAVILFVGLTIEHIIQGGLLGRETEASKKL